MVISCPDPTRCLQFASRAVSQGQGSYHLGLDPPKQSILRMYPASSLVINAANCTSQTVPVIFQSVCHGDDGRVSDGRLQSRKGHNAELWETRPHGIFKQSDFQRQNKLPLVKNTVTGIQAGNKCDAEILCSHNEPK